MNRTERRRQQRALRRRTADAAKLAPQTKALIEQGLARHRLGDLDNARTAYAQALANDPDNGEANYLQGIAHHQSGRSQVGLPHLERAVDAVPNNPTYHFDLGNLYEACGRLEDGQKSFERAIHLDPNLIDARYNLGNNLLAQGRLEEAVAIYKDVVRLRPDHAKAHSNLGNVLQTVGRLSEAQNAYVRTLELDPSNHAVQHMLHALRGENRSPTAARIRYAMTFVYVSQGVICAVRGCVSFPVTGARRIAPAHHEFWRTAVLVLRQSPLALAIVGFGLAFWPSVSVGQSERYANLMKAGNASYQSGNYPDARQSYEAAYQAALKFGTETTQVATALNNLAEVYRLLGNFSKAEEFVAYALHVQRKLLGDDHIEVATVLNNLGNIRLQQQNIEGAIEALTSSLTIYDRTLPSNHPEIAMAANNLGRAHQALGAPCTSPIPSRTRAAYPQQDATQSPRHGGNLEQSGRCTDLSRQTRSGRTDAEESTEHRGKCLR